MSLAALTGLAGSLSGGGAAGADVTPSSANLRNQITVAPVATNLGEIIRQFTENPLHGGDGVVAPSRYIDSVNSSPTRQPLSAPGTAGQAFNKAGLIGSDPRNRNVIIGLGLVVGAVAIALFSDKRR